MSTDPRVRLLQFADGLFPAGGYAHSFGLETCVHDGRVWDRVGLEAFLRTYLEGSAGPCDAVVVVEAGRLARAEDLGALLELDAELDAMRGAAEPREAGRQMGRQTLRVAAALVSSPLLLAAADAADRGRTPAQHPVVFGLLGGVLDWASVDAAQAYLQGAATIVVSAALRLMSMGQLEGQKALFSVGPLISRLAREAAVAGRDDLWSFTPGLEIAGMRHSRLDARLFRS
jgi:urease accessory protein